MLDVYPVGTAGRLGGGDTLGAEKLGDGCASVLGADSTYGWYGFAAGGCEALWLMLWTSGSAGSSSGGAGGCSCCSCTGLLAFGSSPALMALMMRRAWYFAYLVFEATSGSSFFQMLRMSRKVEAAMSVSAVAAVTLFSVMSLSPFPKVCSANCSQYALAATSSSSASSPGMSAFVCSSFSIRSVV